MNNKNYGILNLRFLDKIIEKKRYEMFKYFKKKLSNNSINSFLDIGTTEESLLSSSNFFVKKFDPIKVKKSISNQNIEEKKFNYFLKNQLLKNFFLMK